jgi:F420-non-reducing hydrogenase iron-sulfur subunit
MTEFEPKIIGFLCNWCSYAGADLAGVSRIQYPPNMRVVRVMCSGRIDPIIPLEVFSKGADGVLILGCHPGDCHYSEGNLYEERKIKMVKKLLALTGLEPERLKLEWVSASEGQRFARLVSEFTDKESGAFPPLWKDPEPDDSRRSGSCKRCSVRFPVESLGWKRKRTNREKQCLPGESRARGFRLFDGRSN